MGSNPTSDMFTFLKLYLFVFVFDVVMVVVVVLLKSGKIVQRIKEPSKKLLSSLHRQNVQPLNFRFTRTYDILLILAIVNRMFTLSLVCQDGRAV